MKKSNEIGDVLEKLRKNNIRIYQTKLDPGVKGMVRKYRDGYLVFVEESLCFDAMLGALKHELAHIILGHLDDDIKSEAQKENEVSSILREVQ